MKLKINKKTFESFDSYTLNLKYNAVASSFSFNGLKDYLPGFISFAYADIYTDENDLLLAGQIISTSYTESPLPSLVSCSGYSKTGVLEDCTISINSYPLQSDNLTLKQIADKYLNAYGIKYTFSENVASDMDKKYTKTVCNPTDSLKNFIQSLATQRGIIMTHKQDGSLFFTRLEINKLKPINNVQVNSISFGVNGQSLHSDITVMRQVNPDSPTSAQYTIKNPYVSTYRHATKILNKGNKFDIEKAARVALSEELTAINFSIATNTFVKPGNLIIVDLSIFGFSERAKLFVSETEITGNASSEKYVLSCQLPEVYAVENAVFGDELD